MNRRQYAIAVSFFISLLTVALIPLSGQQGSSYNPWLDYNDDGLIDINDLQALAQAYGTSGAPLDLPMSLQYDSDWVDIHDKQGQAFNITHDLNSANLFFDITGKWVADGSIHQKLNDATCRLLPEGWRATFAGFSATSMAQTADGGYALAGQTLTGGPADFILVKIDPWGVEQWNRTYGTAEHEIAYSVIQTPDEGFALAGGAYRGASMEYDFWLVKTDAAGNLQWNRTYGGAREDWPTSLIHTMDGGYAIAGYTESFSQAPLWWDFYLVKTDPDGFMVWNKTYDHYGTGLADEWTYAAIQTADWGYALAGYTQDVNDINAWLVKTDSVGNAIWNKTYGGSGLAKAFSVIRTFDDGYALAGWTNSSEGGFYLVKTDAVGNMVWNKTYGETSAGSVVQTTDGGYTIAGYGVEGGKFVRTDSSGNELFTQMYPWMEGIGSMFETDDGGYIMHGQEAVMIHLVKTNDWGFLSFPQVGLTIVESTLNVITLYRGAADPYWNYVRVRIWVVRENP